MKKLLMIPIIFLVPGISFAQRLNLLLESTFEEPKAIDHWFGRDSCCNYSMNRSSDFARAGQYSCRFELHNTDSSRGQSTRTELYQAYESSQYVERWYGFSIYLPLDYMYDPCPEVLWQIHANTNTSPPIAVGTLKGHWVFSISYDTGATQHPIYFNIPEGIWTPGTWTDWVIHVRWDDGSRGNGILQVWKNATLIYNATGKNDYSHNLTFYNGGHYLKTGIYKWPYALHWGCTTKSRVVYLDEVRIGNEKATYADVAPGTAGK